MKTGKGIYFSFGKVEARPYMIFMLKDYCLVDTRPARWPQEVQTAIIPGPAPELSNEEPNCTAGQHYSKKITF